MSTADLTQLLTVLRDFGVTKYSCGDLSLEMGKADTEAPEQAAEPSEYDEMMKKIPAKYRGAFTID